MILACAGFTFLLPRTAGAFWPFAVTKADTGVTPVLHNASLDLLQAPISTYIGDTIDSSSSLTAITPDGSALIPGGSLGTTTPADTGSTQDTLNVPSNSSISQYTVQSGDSLSQIAANYGVSVNTILWANNIKDPSTIKEGTVLVILPVSGVQHTVRSGETLSSIADKFSADATDIAQFNGIPADGSLTAGSVIIIPGGELPTASAVPAKSSTKRTSSEGSVKSKPSSESVSTGVTHYSNETHNPYKGGSGAAHIGFFSNPLPGAILTQSIHGWNAVDLGAHTGTPVLAAASGNVILSRSGGWNGGYGSYVILQNKEGIETLYAHLSEVSATVGESVSSGQTIGAVGTTGDATGPHLHFEVRGARNPFASCVEMTVCSPE